VIRFSGRAILLDIEGTMAPISFVHDVLFPYARQKLRPYLETHWNEPDLKRALDLIAHDVKAHSFADWSKGLNAEQTRARLVEELDRQMGADLKLTGLKELQGLIWRDGYIAGELVSPVYDDVPPALADWRERGLDVRIYSSGSVGAQKQFFAHTTHGNLLRFFKGHYDTTTGPKKEPASYARIAADMNQEPANVLFLSDVTAELDAARASGLKTGLLVRQGNLLQGEGHGHPTLTEFGQVGR